MTQVSFEHGTSGVPVLRSAVAPHWLGSGLLRYTTLARQWLPEILLKIIDFELYDISAAGIYIRSHKLTASSNDTVLRSET